MNTRLQVEHGVTEEVTGIDLVEWMVRLAAGESLALGATPIAPQGWSIQTRIYAEDPGKDFQPSSGRLTCVDWPRAGARIETWIETGGTVTPYYDPMLAKIIVRGSDRPAALAALRTALSQCRLAGIETNLEYLKQVAASADFARGGISTAYLRGFEYRRRAVDVVGPGTQTTVQDYPGRLGYWHVGVPPSGPMDSLALRAANRLVGNAEGAPALEFTVLGPTLRFREATLFALAGADFSATLDGAPVANWKPAAAAAGATLVLGACGPQGARGYLAVAGGFEAASYLGSAATFILGGFGGHAGRTLRAGDVLAIPENSARPPGASITPPAYSNEWEIGSHVRAPRSPGLFHGRGY